ncbi:hypothetical protein HYQ46_009779 [Verticillium longisporum]|nr:hypothetical protein HYQ46_009779 [Verticillium longisporum]
MSPVRSCEDTELQSLTSFSIATSTRLLDPGVPPRFIVAAPPCATRLWRESCVVASPILEARSSICLFP